jgi:hypothetical protein
VIRFFEPNLQPVSLSTVGRLNCPGKGSDVRVQAPIDFKIR